MNGNNVTIYVGNDPHETEPGIQKGADLHNLVGLESPQQLVVSRPGAIDIPIGENDYLVVEDGDKFAIGDGNPPLEDNPCLRKGIKFTLNDVKFSGKDALTKAKWATTELKALYQDTQPGDGLFAEVRGSADERIPDDVRIIVQDRDRFITVPCGNVGEEARALFQPLEEQVEELQRLHQDVDLLPNNQGHYVVIRDFPLPEGWDQETTDVLFIIPPSFPIAGLDMFWIASHIKLPNGRWPEAGDAFENHIARNWQRFSWHYPGNYRWNPSRDTLVSHLRFCTSRLNQLR